MQPRGGLSPLARGTLQVGAHQNHLIRFIPAGAGNTLPYFFIVHVHAVYPRWRGEHFLIHDGEQYLTGLSPLARGTLDDVSRPILAKRFIPAGAGNTAPRRQIPHYTTVYPRWRGEHFSGSFLESDQGGLSPLARGTRAV